MNTVPGSTEPEPAREPSLLPWFEKNAMPLFLAPMAGYTDIVYRSLCKREGVDVVVTEFVMSDSVILNHEAAWETVAFHEDQRPVGIQIFGSDPASMAQAASLLVTRCNPDFIDLNFGCPSERVTCMAAGASLLREPDRLLAIADSVVKAIPSTPVTAKIRIGWDANSIIADSLAPRLEDAGIRALTIHGRTREQGYQGEANWALIRRIAETAKIPIVGNGNIQNTREVYDLMKNSKVRGVMIGRAALGYPWIFGAIKSHLETGLPPLPPSLRHRWDTMLLYATMLAARPQRQNPSGQIMWMRPKLVKLTKEMIGCKQLRLRMLTVQSFDDLRMLAEEHIYENQERENLLFEKLTSLRERRRLDA